MRKITKWAAILAVLAAAVLHATPATAAPDQTYKFFNAHWNLCIDVAYGSTGSGARIQNWDCYGGTPQQWRQVFIKRIDPFDYYELRNVNSNKCLDVPWGNPAPGVALQQMDCWGGDMQLWAVEMTYAADQAYRIRNLMTNGCVSADAVWGRGATIWQQPCQLNDLQKWRTYAP